MIRAIIGAAAELGSLGLFIFAVSVMVALAIGQVPA
jgi:hypothetical protein